MLGTAVRDCGNTARLPPARSVTLVKLPPCTGLAWQPSRREQGKEKGNEPLPTESQPRCLAGRRRGCGGPGGTECWRAAGVNKTPETLGTCRCPCSRRCAAGWVGVRCPGTAGARADVPRNAPGPLTCRSSGDQQETEVSCPPPRCRRRSPAEAPQPVEER